jgi:hypothetical protein
MIGGVGCAGHEESGNEKKMAAHRTVIAPHLVARNRRR